MNDTLSTFKDILTELLNVEATDIAKSSNLAADLGADSLDLVEIALACEEEFGIQNDHDELEQLETVGEWVALIERKLAA